jgi:hypothetical protein
MNRTVRSALEEAFSLADMPTVLSRIKRRCPGILEKDLLSLTFSFTLIDLGIDELYLDLFVDDYIYHFIVTMTLFVLEAHSAHIKHPHKINWDTILKLRFSERQPDHSVIAALREIDNG